MTHDDSAAAHDGMPRNTTLYYITAVDSSHGFWNDVCAVYLYIYIYLRYNALADLWLGNYCSRIDGRIREGENLITL